jgi:hypothetical protein
VRGGQAFGLDRAGEQPGGAVANANDIPSVTVNGSIGDGADASSFSTPFSAHFTHANHGGRRDSNFRSFHGIIDRFEKSIASRWINPAFISCANASKS